MLSGDFHHLDVGLDHEAMERSVARDDELLTEVNMAELPGPSNLAPDESLEEVKRVSKKSRDVKP